MVIEHLYALNQEGYIQLFKSFGYSELEWIKTGNPFLITHNLQEALLAAEKNNSQPAIENIMFNLAQSYEKNENFEDAIHWYKKCLSEPYFSTEVYQADILASIILNMICQEKFYDAEILMDRLSFIDKLQDTQLRESMTAVKYYLQAKNAYCLNHADTDEIQRLLQDSLCFIRTKPFIELDMKIEELYGDLAKRHENYTEAIESYERALGLATGKKSMSIIYNKLSEVYEKTGDERLAFENYSRYYQLSEELCRERSKQYSEYLLKIYNISDAENDIVQLKKKGETLTCSRNTDFLTGLNNRRYFEETIQNMLDNPEYSPVIVSILMMDVDNFKNYNDQYGHLQGDEILGEIGEILKTSVKRNMDIAARYGGEEFIILLYATGLQGSKRVALEILEKVRQLSEQYHGRTEPISLSIGIDTGLLQSKQKLKNIIREADKALYYSKEHGKNTYTHAWDIYQPGE